LGGCNAKKAAERPQSLLTGSCYTFHEKRGRPLRLDAAPRRQPRAQTALLDPVLRQSDYDATIAPLDALIAPGEKPRYEPLHNGRYMVDFYDKGMAYLKRKA
jgi:hypothetical protein